MNYQNYGLGKTYTSVSEAFKDADYATAIDCPEYAEYDLFWGLMGALFFVAVFAYGFYKTTGG